MITILDYSVNNLRSVQKAFEHLGHATRVTSRPEELLQAEKVVLPGVGAFGEAMKNLGQRQLIEPLLKLVNDGVPVLGVCLGMQLLFDESEELGVHRGLGVVAGRVARFPDVPGLKVPHMGWSRLHFCRASRLFDGLDEGEMAYFVHSYHVVPEDQGVIAAVGDHGGQFVAGFERENVMGAQFHPEKSSVAGLKILNNFARL